MAAIPNLKLNDGNEIPQLGFGLYKVAATDAGPAVAEALRSGWTLIDTAQYYGNEAEAGAAIAEADVHREDLQVATKLWHTDLGYDNALRAFDLSLERLRLDYLDLYLIHWPVPGRDLYVETWRALERLQEEGRVRSIGVSNFTVECLERLLEESSTIPAVNQIELHPNLPQEKLRSFHAEHGIATQAWSPLAHGKLLADPTVVEIADRHGTSPAQVLLRWNLDLGNSVVTKSITPQRIRANLSVFDLHLDDKDRQRLAELDNGERTGPDPEVYGSQPR